MAYGGSVGPVGYSTDRFTQPVRTQTGPGQSLGGAQAMLASVPGRPNPYAQALQGAKDFATVMHTPAAAGLNQNYTQMGQQYNLALQGYGLSQQQMNANYGFDARSLGVKEAGLGIDRGAIDRLNPLLDSRLQMAQQMRGFLEPELNARTDETWRNMDFEKFKSQAETRSRGAIGSEGFREDTKDIEKKAQFGVDELYRSYQRDVLRANDDIGGAWENIQKNKDAKAQLDLQAQQLGIDRERLASSLQLGLQRLGLDTQMSVNELLQRMNSNRTDYQMLGQKIFDQALQMTPIFQSASYLPPAMQASLIGRK